MLKKVKTSKNQHQQGINVIEVTKPDYKAINKINI